MKVFLVILIAAISCFLAVKVESLSINDDKLKPPPPPGLKKYCYAQNDPHMKNFNDVLFEFQKVGTYCMYNSGKVNVDAQFEQCFPGQATPTCNCRVRVKVGLLYLEVNTCVAGGLVSVAKSQSSINYPFLPGGLVNTNFEIGRSGTYYYIKTKLNTLDDIEVRIYEGWVKINRIEIYPSANYLSSGLKDRDCCLCGRYKERDLVLAEDTIKENCQKALLNGQIDEIGRFLDDEGRQDLTTLVDNCVQDILAQSRSSCDVTRPQFGLFQKDLVNAKTIESLARVLDIDLIKSGEKILDYLRKICEIQGKLFDESIINSFYGKTKSISLQFCIDQPIRNQ